MLSLTFCPLTGAIKHDNIILVLAKMVEAAYFGSYCSECTLKGFIHLDFHLLKKSYTKKELGKLLEGED